MRLMVVSLSASGFWHAEMCPPKMSRRLETSRRLAAASTLSATKTTGVNDDGIAISVVTYERPEYLRRCVEQIASQRLAMRSRLTVIIIDDSSQSCKDSVEAKLAAKLDDYLAPARVIYEFSAARCSIGAKRSRALRRAEELKCSVLCNWDDDDVFGEDRLELQVEPILSGWADATVASPQAWRWETGAYDPTPRVMSWGRLAFGSFLAAIDPRCELGTEILDEALASLCFRIDLAAHLEYPDISYDEDRVFVAALKSRGLRLRRLAPGRPAYVHVKHPRAAAYGPLSRLYAANLGFLASPIVALPLTSTAIYAAGRLIAELRRT